MSVSYKSSATSSASTITAPSDIVSGDLIILLDLALDFMDYPALVTPSGFTSIGNVTVNYFSFQRQNLSYKIADGSEAGATITGMTGARKALYVFTATNAISAVSVQSYSGIGTIVDPSPQTVTSGSGVSPLIVLAGYGSPSAIDPRSFSPAKDGEITSGGYLYLAYKIYNSSPSDVTIDMEDESAQTLQSCYLEITEESSSLSLTCAEGSFSLTGQDANLVASRTISIDQAAFSLNGQDASFNISFTSSLEYGSFSLTGQSSTLIASRVLSLSDASFSLTGISATLGTPYILTADTGIFSLYGYGVTLDVPKAYEPINRPPSTKVVNATSGVVNHEWSSFFKGVSDRLNTSYVKTEAASDYGLSFLGLTSASAARDALELGSLATVDATLGNLAELNASTFALTLLDDSDAATARETLGVSATPGSWTAYTPTVNPITGSFTTTSSTGRYFQLGKLVFFTARVTLTNIGTGSGLRIGLPATSANSTYIVTAYESAATNMSGTGRIDPSSNEAYVNTYNGGTVDVNGYVWTISGVYEAS